MRSVLALSALALAAVLSASPAAAATVLDVSKNEGCGKASCFNDQGVFTQTWSAKDAAGPMTIGKLLLDRGVLGNLDGSTFRISFTLNGAEVGSWGNYMMAGIAGGELTFSGQAFTWNPEDGDLSLVLQIDMPKQGARGGDGSFASFNPDYNYGGVEFEGIAGSVISAAPEPTAWALMITGFGLAGSTLRQRRRARVVA